MAYMRQDFSPMLAAALCRPSGHAEELAQNLNNIVYPVFATPKFDGVRCVTMDYPTVPPAISVPMCRSLKQVPNHHVRKLIASLPVGLDGEIMTYEPKDMFEDRDRPRSFHEIQSDVMRFEGTPNFRYHVFDANIFERGQRYMQRLETLKSLSLPEFCSMVLPVRCADRQGLEEYMAKCLAAGYEGICFRDMLGPYKHGRSTIKQGWLVKWKLFATSEAVIVGFEERMHNANPPEKNELGYQERSSHQANMVPCGDLGAFRVRIGDLWLGEDKPNEECVEFKIGTGFTAQQRVELWAKRDELMGKIVTFKHQQYGARNVLRLPVFVGIRDRIDMS